MAKAKSKTRRGPPAAVLFRPGDHVRLTGQKDAPVMSVQTAPGPRRPPSKDYEPPVELLHPIGLGRGYPGGATRLGKKTIECYWYVRGKLMHAWFSPESLELVARPGDSKKLDTSADDDE